MGHKWVLYGQKSLYGAHVGIEWDKCPDSAHMGPTYACLLGNHLINNNAWKTKTGWLLVREIPLFFKVRENPGNFAKWSGKF